MCKTKAKQIIDYHQPALDFSNDLPATQSARILNDPAPVTAECSDFLLDAITGAYQRLGLH
jgi:hypothetical protein